MPGEPRYTISCEGLVIGHAVLQPRRASPSVLRGVFAPTESYAAAAPLFHAEAVAHVYESAAGEEGPLEVLVRLAAAALRR
jgi:hypothetical protein